MPTDDHADKSARRFQSPLDHRQDRSPRSWRWYVDDDIETDPVELVQSLGLLTVSRQSRHYEQSLYEQIHQTLLLDELKRLAEHLESPPSPSDMRRFGAYSPHEYLDAFDSWTEAFYAADITPPETTDSERTGVVEGKYLQFECLPDLFENENDEEELIRDLREFASTLGAPPQRVDMQKFGPHSIQEYIDLFGSWSQALAAAGMESPSTRSKSDRVYSQEYEALAAEVEQTVTGDELCQELYRLSRALETLPTEGDVTKFSPYTPQMYIDQFGSWTDALHATGITCKQDDLEGTRRWWSPIRWLWTTYRLIWRQV